MAQPPLLTITAEPLDLMALTPLLREGVLIDLSPGLSLRQTMIQDLGFCPECVEERVQTVFLDGSPVDDIDADSAAPGCTLALAGALPGVAGIAMRRGSPVGAFRQGITHVPTAAKGVEAFQVTLKLFNSVALECLPVVLEQGIITTAQRLAELLASDADVLSHAAFKLGGKLVDRAALLDALRTLGGSLRLEAETVPRSKSKEPLSPPERALLPDDMEALATIAEAAGAAIMEVRRNGFSVEYKQDHSPLTQADLAAHRVIMHGLAQHFPGVPVLSEEGAGIPYEERAQWRQMFIVDPLDGTKEFVKELGEFCVCIALAEGGYPALGAVHVPVWGATYVGGLGRGCYKRERGTEWGSITVRQPDENAGLIVLASRSHPQPGHRGLACR